MKIIKILSEKKGFTLIELAVSTIILVILVMAASMILAPTLNAYRKANETAETNILLDNIANDLVSDLSRATAVNIDDITHTLEITTSDNLLKYSVDVTDGILMKGNNIINPAPVLAKDFYKGRTVSFTVTEPQPKAFVVSLAITDKSGNKIGRDYAVRPVALNQF